MHKGRSAKYSGTTGYYISSSLICITLDWIVFQVNIHRAVNTLGYLQGENSTEQR